MRCAPSAPACGCCPVQQLWPADDRIRQARTRVQRRTLVAHVRMARSANSHNGSTVVSRWPCSERYCRRSCSAPVNWPPKPFGRQEIESRRRLNSRWRTWRNALRIADEYVEMDTPSEALKRKLQEIQLEINGLREQVSEERDDRLADQQLAAWLQSLLGEPLKLFDTLSNEKQARIYQILFQQVRISCTGRGTGRQWRLLEYAPTFGGGPVKVADSATVRLPNPSEIRVGKRA